MSEQLALLTFESKTVDRIVVAFTGSVELNLEDPADRAVFDALRLGTRHAFTVAGSIDGRTVKRKEATEKAPETVTSTATLSVDYLHSDARKLAELMEAEGVTIEFNPGGAVPAGVGG